MQMQLKPEERNKAILLVLGSVVFMGFAVKTILGARNPQPVAQPAASSATVQTASVTAPVPGTATASPQQAQAVAALYMTDSGPAFATRDPFKPPVAVYVPGPDTKKKTAGVAPSLPGGLPGKGGRVSPLLVRPPSLPAVALKGVIDGDPPIAVFESNGQTLYVKKGEPLAPGTQVAHISEAGVVLKYQGKDLALMVGHAIQATQGVAEGVPVRPMLPAPAPVRSVPENSTITSAPSAPAPSGTGITELSPSEIHLPGQVPFQIASLHIPAAPAASMDQPAPEPPAKRAAAPRQVSAVTARHKVRRHKHRRHRKHGRHHRHRHRHAAHHQAQTAPAPPAAAAHQ